MRSMIRAKRYPESYLGAHYWMGSILRYLDGQMRGCDIFRLLAVCEAVSLIEMARENVRREIDSTAHHLRGRAGEGER